MVKIKEVIKALEEYANPGFQESYDNAQLIVGDASWEAKGALLTLDSTEDVVLEAVEKGCNLIVAHHPIVFSGLKQLTGSNYIERTIILAIKYDIAIYAMHTNLDNVSGGVNFKIAHKIGLENVKVLAPKRNFLRKLYTYIPLQFAEKVKSALFEAGAGNIGNYSECAFEVMGTGSFLPNEKAKPTLGQKGERHHEQELKVEVLYNKVAEGRIIEALKSAHPYEEVAYECVSIENEHQEIGSGAIGELIEPIAVEDFLLQLKKLFNAGIIKYTPPISSTIKKVALCGGSGSFLLPQAIRKQADIFITADFKYHEFFDADGRIMIADIGHYESEQYTKELFKEILQKKIPNFATHLSQVITNPINYI
jgi:dinuclear metal center YbgI/SA1388 family protein